MFSADWFFDLEKTLRERGLDSDDKSFDEIRDTLSNPKKLSPTEFASAVSYVILASGFNQNTAKKIHKIIMPLMNQNPTIDDLKKFFKNDVKLKSIIKVWQNKNAFCDEYYNCKNLDEKISCLKKLPYIGDITVNHLARNLGENVVKYDRWIQRLGIAFAMQSTEFRVQSSVVADNQKLNPEIKKYCDDMFAHLEQETNLPRGYIDVVLFKSAQNGLIKGLKNGCEN